MAIRVWNSAGEEVWARCENSADRVGRALLPSGGNGRCMYRCSSSVSSRQKRLARVAEAAGAALLVAGGPLEPRADASTAC
eukprot:6187828-Pleurochrysis_carterae.AAC.6